MGKYRRYSRAELEKMLRAYTYAHGRPPKRSEVPPGIMMQIRREWGKWIYAIEDIDLKPVNEDTLARRKRRRAKSKRKDEHNSPEASDESQ